MFVILGFTALISFDCPLLPEGDNSANYESATDLLPVRSCITWSNFAESFRASGHEVCPSKVALEPQQLLRENIAA